MGGARPALLEELASRAVELEERLDVMVRSGRDPVWVGGQRRWCSAAAGYDGGTRGLLRELLGLAQSCCWLHRRLVRVVDGRGAGAGALQRCRRGWMGRCDALWDALQNSRPVAHHKTIPEAQLFCLLPHPGRLPELPRNPPTTHPPSPPMLPRLLPTWPGPTVRCSTTNPSCMTAWQRQRCACWVDPLRAQPPAAAATVQQLRPAQAAPGAP